MPATRSWKWWLMDRDHWVGDPDRRVRVTDMSDDWLGKVLGFLASWSEERVEDFTFTWMKHRHYFDPVELAEFATLAVNMEIDILCEQSHREWLVNCLVPCLETLEAEAQRRGLPVPSIPSYECHVTRARAVRAARMAKEAEMAPRRRPAVSAKRSRPRP